MNNIKLTPKQKEIIKAMRESDEVLYWHHSLTKFTYKGKTFRYDLGTDLQNKRLIERNKDKTKVLWGYYFQLTELGKTINI